MTKQRHSDTTPKDEWASSDAFVYARRRDADVTAPLVHLEQGTAEQMRQLTKTELRCPVTDCDSPDITTVRRAHLNRRDGFAHLARGVADHAPESIEHAHLKTVIAATVAAQHPDVQVAEEVPCADGQRRADVLLTWPDGAQTAIEVQVSPLAIDEWAQRHDSYRQFGIHDVWVVPTKAGPDPKVPHLRTATGFVLPALEASAQVAFVDINRGLIGTPHVGRRLPRWGEKFTLWWSRLDTAPWTSQGVRADAWHRLVTSRDIETTELEQKRAREQDDERERERELERQQLLDKTAAREAAAREAAARKAAAREVERAREERRARNPEQRLRRNQMVAAAVIQQRASDAHGRRRIVEQAVNEVMDQFTFEGFDLVEFLHKQYRHHGPNQPIARILAQLRGDVPATHYVESTMLRMFVEQAGKISARLGLPVLTFMDAAVDVHADADQPRLCAICDQPLQEWVRRSTHPPDVCPAQAGAELGDASTKP